MAKPYGITDRGVSRAVRDRYKELNKRLPEQEVMRKFIGMLQECIADVSGKAVELRDWLIQLARELANDNRGV